MDKHIEFIHPYAKVIIKKTDIQDFDNDLYFIRLTS